MITPNISLNMNFVFLSIYYEFLLITKLVTLSFYQFCRLLIFGNEIIKLEHFPNLNYVRQNYLVLSKFKLYQSILREKYMTNPSIKNIPILPIKSA